MLRKGTIEEGTLDLIKKFMSDEKFKDFSLVGGTALALMIGHRISVDIDLFSTTPFNASDIGTHLASRYGAEEIRTLQNGVFCFVNNIKIDLIAHQYPLLKKFEWFLY
jgi:Nucleotidyl transferase AbiEii toxin, Type IV TA system